MGFSNRNEKVQLSLMHFAKPKNSSARPPSNSRRDTRAPLRKMPRPSAPPFFAKSPSPARPVSSRADLADDAWQVAERALFPTAPRQSADDSAYISSGDSGDSVASHQKSPQQRTAHPTNNSDSDFESDAAVSRVARERLSRSATSAAARLANDRASMTKRSAKKNKAHAPPPPISPKRTHSPRRKSHHLSRPSLFSSSEEEEEEDLEHLVFEGEKSELSATDTDRDIDAPTPPIEPRRLSLPTSRVTPSEGNRKNRPIRNLPMSTRTPRETLTPKPLLLPMRPVAPPPKKCKQISLSDNSASSASDIPSTRLAPTRERSVQKRARVLKFDSDSDLSVDQPITTRKPSRTRQLQFSSSSSSSSLQGSPFARQRSFAPSKGASSQLRPRRGAADRVILPRRQERRSLAFSDDDENCSPSVNNKGLFTLSPKSREHCVDLDSEPVLDISSSDNQPVVRSRRLSSSKRRRTLRKISITPPSTPSPPSTKKRRRFSRLKGSFSTEEDEPVDNMPRVQNIESQHEVARQAAKGNIGKSPEWFYERNIADFSSSEGEGSPLRFPKRKRVSSARVKPRAPGKRYVKGSSDKSTSVRRDLLGMFSDDEAGTVPPEDLDLQHPRKVSTLDRSSRRQNRKKIKKITTTSLCQDEVVDLIEDEEDAIISAETENHSLAPRDVDSIECSRQESDEIIDLADDKPPPFNLVALCEPGESIRQMKERLGEEALMDDVIKAQKDGREILGGEEIGLTAGFNREVFSRFSETVVADQLTRKRKAKSVTEKALRGEYKFNYRGRNDDASGTKRGPGRASWRGRGRGGTSYSRKRRC